MTYTNEQLIEMAGQVATSYIVQDITQEDVDFCLDHWNLGPSWRRGRYQTQLRAQMRKLLEYHQSLVRNRIYKLR